LTDEDRIYENVHVPDLITAKPLTSVDTAKFKSSTPDTFAKTGSILRSFWCEMPEVRADNFFAC